MTIVIRRASPTDGSALMAAMCDAYAMARFHPQPPRIAAAPTPA